MTMWHKVERLKRDRLHKWARTVVPEKADWIVENLSTLREHLEHHVVGATKAKIKIRGRKTTDVNPADLTFEVYSRITEIEGDIRTLVHALFTAHSSGVYFVNLMTEVHSVKNAEERQDRVEGKLENKGDEQAAMRELRKQFDTECREIAETFVYPQVRIYVPRESHRTFYVVKTADDTEVYEKSLGDQNDPSLLRWFKSYVWTEPVYQKLHECVDRLADRYAMFNESKDVNQWLRHVLRLMDSEDQYRFQLDDTSMGIITAERKEWAWGVVSVPKGDATKSTPAWDQWEQKFSCQAMVNWWRVWLGLIFDPEVATGKATEYNRSKANLGLVWVRSSGKEGSSVILEVISSRLGRNITTVVRAQTDQFEMAQYFGKRCAFFDDARTTRMLFRGNYHSVVTGSEQSIETKGNQAFKAWVNCGMFCSSNRRIVANRFATDQMRRLIYIVLKRTYGNKTPDWASQLHSEWGDYMAKVRATYEPIKAKYGTEDIFHHYEEEEIADYYAAELAADAMATVHEYVRANWVRNPKASITLTALAKLYRTTMAKVGGRGDWNEDNFEEIVLRDISADREFSIKGNVVYGLSVPFDADHVAEQIGGESTDSDA